MRIICRVIFGKPSARKVEGLVNSYLADGWQVDTYDVMKLGWFRCLVVIVLSNTDE